MIDHVLAGLKLEFGSIKRADTQTPIRRISTGSPVLDQKIGGGIPCGRMTTLIGDPSTGKTTLCLSIAEQVHRTGKDVLWIDTEHKWDAQYATTLGLDLTRVWLSTSSIEENIKVIEQKVTARGPVGLIVWDSIAQSVSQSGFAKEATEGGFAAARAAAFSQHWPRMLSRLEAADIPIVCTNQWRMKGIGGTIPAWRDQFGGFTIKYVPTLIISLDKATVNHRGDIPVSQSVTFTVRKNQAGQAYQTGIFEIDFDQEAGWYGVSRLGDIFNSALDLGLIQKSGSWYSITIGEKEFKVQGKSSLKYQLGMDEEALTELEKLIFG